jgi:hypothetical protein
MKSNKTPIGLIARARAAWNKDKGGVVLTGKWGKNDHNGSHYRVVVDGGNVWHGREQWVLSRASGGFYSLRDSAMARAVAQVLGVSVGIKEEEDISDCEWNWNWDKIAKKHGWTLYAWREADTVVMIPNEEAAELAIASYNLWEAKNNDKKTAD